MPQQLFVFIQFEFPWALGPPDGRYLLRSLTDGEPERVVVIGSQLSGRLPERAQGGGIRLPGLRRAPASTPTEPEPEPTPVQTSRVTVIDPVSLSAENQARAWLADMDREREVGLAVAIVNRVVHSHRIAAADPHVHEVSPAQALVIRAGWGEGEQVADGRWLHARALAWEKGAHGAKRRRGPLRDRTWALRPQERLAAMLGARGQSLMCEELALRARSDLDHGRVAHAALELDRAIALAVAELRAERREDLAVRIAELEQLHANVHAQAAAALALDGSESDEQALAHALGRLEAALRARTATGVQ
jgi:hypothetical protein